MWTSARLKAFLCIVAVEELRDLMLRVQLSRQPARLTPFFECGGGPSPFRIVGIGEMGEIFLVQIRPRIFIGKQQSGLGGKIVLCCAELQLRVTGEPLVMKAVGGRLEGDGITRQTDAP